MSSNRQPTCDVYVTVSREKVHRTSCHSDNTVNVDLDRDGIPVGVEIIGALSVTVDGQEARPIPNFPDGDFVDKVTAALAGYRHNLGPNTLSLIRDGVWKSLPLSLGEMRDIAWLLHEAGLLKGAGEAG